MSEPTRAEQIERRLTAALSESPKARVAGVRPDGLFCALPGSVHLGDHQIIDDARAGMDMVSAEYRVTVLEQFRELGTQGASEVEVALVTGARARYSLFDVTETHSVVVLVVAELPPGEEMRTEAPRQPQAVRPRSGRVRRTEYAEFLDADDALLAMLLYSREAFAALDTAESMHPDDYPAMISLWFDLLGAEPGSSRRVRVRYRRGDGSWLWVEITVTQRLDDPGEPHMLCEIVDISEEMTAVDELWRSRELLHRLTESLPIGILQVDTEGRVVHSNDRLVEILQVARAATLRDQFVRALGAELPNLVTIVQQALEAGVDGDLECRFRRPGDGSRGYAQIACRSLRGRDEAVTGAILCVTDVTDSARLRKELEQRASLDTLTGCLNRATVMAELERMLAREHGSTAVAFVDLDLFKPVNDQLGHAAGDELLKRVADVLRGAVRDGDLVGRLGGDEFVVLCPGVATMEAAQRVGERLRGAVRFEARVAGVQVPVRASIGIAWTEAAASPEDLVNTADKAMYESKRDRRQQPAYLACG